MTKVNRCLAEGRKRFLARYAGIEAGEECRRWAPVLSAMLDGEATAEQMLELRPHLRNCAGCRAALRELRGSNAPLAALFPIGGVALVGGADGPLAGASEALGRVWHALWGELSDRAATAALRAQSMAHGMFPGKAVATAASALALAGGGYAVEETRGGGAPARAVLHAQAPSAATDRLMTLARSTAPAELAVHAPATRTAPRRATRTRRARVPRRTVVRAAARTTAASTASARPAAVTTRAAARRTPAATVATPAPVRAPAAGGAAPRPSAGAGGGSEFALERG